ncbi:MAG TPA: cation transporter [Gemmatimonadales bacterium]|nr:cation transporter [Gemmatimonadales bacterium]
MTEAGADRAGVVRRGLHLNYLTLAYNTVEAVVALAAGVVSGSVALVGFGIDSGIEMTASVAAQWRLRMDRHDARRIVAERRTRRIIGICFLALAVWVGFDASESLLRREAPEPSPVGVGILVLSALVMPWLARQKRSVAQALSSHALKAEAKQTSLCAWLSVIAMAGVGANAVAGWWWADPVAALAMTPIIFQEGIEGVRTR